LTGAFTIESIVINNYMEKPANIKTAAAQNGQVRSNAKILLVDDREDNLFSIEAILEKMITPL
jgi:hypothetical protein